MCQKKRWLPFRRSCPVPSRSRNGQIIPSCRAAEPTEPRTGLIVGPGRPRWRRALGSTDKKPKV
eukprot:3940714-Alexandrium_andersonii.AAC.1